MKVYFWCPYFRTGGPESLTQWCDMMNLLGYDASMFYLDASDIPHPSAVKLTDSSPVLFNEKYTHVKRSFDIEDREENILFVPEVVRIDDVRATYKKIRLVIAWLSITSGLPRLDHYLSHPDAIHVFQSFRAHRDVLERARVLGLKEPAWFDIDDYIHDAYTLQGWDPSQKENLVAYNPTKDRVTPLICAHFKITTVPIFGMSFHQVIQTLKRCKVYVDCGNHPGRDRIPREAALLGCIVVTNREGTAECFEDVPVETKARDANELVQMIRRAMHDYPTCSAAQDDYVKIIRESKFKCAKQVQAFWTEFNFKS